MEGCISEGGVQIKSQENGGKDVERAYSVNISKWVLM